MRHEEHFFRTLFEEAPLPYQALDSDGRILTVNRAWQQELGYERHEVLGRLYSDFIAKHERSHFEKTFAEFTERGTVRGIVWTMIRKDGSSLKVSFNGTISCDGGGSVHRAQCIFFDLSKRTAEEEAMRKSEELLMAFMESATEGFFLFDPEMRLVFINESGTHMFDRPRNELIGKPFEEIAPHTAKSDRFKHFKRVLETGEGYVLEGFAPDPDRSDYWCSVHAFKVGENLGITLRDVSDTKRAEEELIVSEARWRSLAEGSPDYVLLLDRELRIEYANRAWGEYDRESMIGTPACEFALEAQRDSVCQALRGVLHSGEPATYESTWCSSSGERRVFEARAVARKANGMTKDLIVSYRDITRRKTDEARIQKLLLQQTAKAQLAMEIEQAESAHDIYRKTHQRVCGLVPNDVFIISRYDAIERQIQPAFVVAEGEEQDVGATGYIRISEQGPGTQSEVIRTGKPLVIPDFAVSMKEAHANYHVARKDARMRPLRPGEDVSDLPRSGLMVPMTIRGDIVGVMQVQSCQRDAYGTDDATQLAGLASIAAVALENQQLIQETQDAYRGVIRALAKAIELRDPYTSQHQEGVARISTKTARQLGLLEEHVRAVSLAANIHDIGKVIIPAEILSKPTTLTTAQMSIVRSHVEAAYDVVQDIPFPWPIADILLQHHERLDGSGYPYGISGDAIRIEARILAVADIADAMLSHRPYRPAFSYEDTINELKSLRSTALDSSVVDACLDVLRHEFTASSRA